MRFRFFLRPPVPRSSLLWDRFFFLFFFFLLAPILPVRAQGMVNLAQGKTATQSSTLADYVNPWAGRAVDGNADGNYWNGSVTHTNYDYQAWWQVDLGSIYSLLAIQVWNRTDCCWDRLSTLQT